MFYTPRAWAVGRITSRLGNGFFKAAGQGHVLAQFSLGLLHSQGHGVEQDYVQAYVWYNIAAAQGNATALKNREVVATTVDPATLAKAQKLSIEYFKRYVEPFQ